LPRVEALGNGALYHEADSWAPISRRLAQARTFYLAKTRRTVKLRS
jgi:hypothetical protein